MYEWIKQNPQFSTNAFNEIAGKILEHQCAQIGVIYVLKISNLLLKLIGRFRQRQLRRTQ